MGKRPSVGSAGGGRACGAGTARSEQKERPAGNSGGPTQVKEGFAGALRNRLRDLGVEIHRVRMVTFDAVQLVASLQHPVELVDQHGDGLVAFVRLDGRIHIGPLDLDMSFGLELYSSRRTAIAFQLDAYAHDALLVTKQSVGFLADERLEGRCQFEVNAGDDYIVILLAVHVSAYGFG
jgi:hypothetical protein